MIVVLPEGTRRRVAVSSRFLFALVTLYLLAGAVALGSFCAPPGGHWWELAVGLWCAFMAWVLTLSARQRRTAERRRALHGPPDRSSVPSEALALGDRGKRIKAIKPYRELSPGLGLDEAKDVIDQL